MKQRIAVVTAPPLTLDGLADMRNIWGDGVELSFYSVLSDKTSESIRPYVADEGDRVLMLNLEDSASTMISVDKLTPRIEEILVGLQGKADFALFACAGDFPKLKSSLLTIQPNILLRNMVKSILQPHTRLGVVTPGEKQIPHVFSSWMPYLKEAGLSEEQLVVDWALPSHDSVKHCSQRMVANNVDIVVVECLGFKEELRKVIAEEVKQPVILVRTVVANFVKECICQTKV